MRIRRHPSRRTRAAFTIAETAMAAAICATVLLVLMSMLPLGLDQFRRAGDREAQARITQAVAGRLQMTGWDELNHNLACADPALTFDFDSKGTLLGPGGQCPALRSYVARARLVSNANALPGDNSAQSWLLRVAVDISTRPDATDPFSDSRNVSTTTMTISKMDR